MSKHPLLVLLPGLMCDHAVWSHQRKALAAQADIQIIGYGTLDRLDKMARHVLELAAAPTFALAGHSMGGRVALEVMRLAPERVSALALLDTGCHPLAGGDTGEAERRSRMDLLAQARAQGMRTMGRRWAQGMVHPDRVDTPVFEDIVAMIERSNAAQFEAQIEALLHRPDATTLLAGIRCPTLVLCGREDFWSPVARHEAMRALILGSALEIIEHCGHMSTMECGPEVSAALARWLDGHQITTIA